MIFRDELLAQSEEVRLAVKSLHVQADGHQLHESDLLLVFNCATNDEFGPTLGYDHIVHAANEQSRFISEVRKVLSIDSEAAIEELRANGFTEAVERVAIHAELTLYLKFWESDYYQRLLYQLSNLAAGKAYDWKFQVLGDASGILNGVRKRLAQPAPEMSVLLKELYSSELRNAIAHSQFYIADEYLQLLNPAGEPTEVIKLSDWRKTISKTLLLHNEIQSLEDRVLLAYRKKAAANGGCLAVRVVSQNSARDVTVSPVRDRKYWVWTENLKRSGFEKTPEGYA